MKGLTFIRFTKKREVYKIKFTDWIKKALNMGKSNNKHFTTVFNFLDIINRDIKTTPFLILTIFWYCWVFVGNL